MHDHLLTDIGLCVCGALAFGLIARLLRQPPLLGYIAAGLVLGPNVGLALIADDRTVGSISEIGLVLLLFLIGAEIDLKKLLRAGPAVLGGGLLGVPLCALVTLPFLALAGWNLALLDAHYIALLLALSSTAIVVKLLYEQNEIDTLPGRITLGILVMQDLWAIVMLAAQPSLDNPDPWVLVQSLLLGLGLVAVVMAAGKYVLPQAFAQVAGSPELTLLMGLGWCALVAGGAHASGLSREMGALMAGVTISTFPVSLEVVTRVLSIRDFFVTLFFVALGLRIPVPTAPLLLAAAGLSLLVVGSRFAVVLPLLRVFTGDNRTSVVTAVNLAQVSEFSLVIAALGLARGHVSSETVGLVTFAMVITAVLSSYLVVRSHRIHLRLSPLLARLGLTDRARAAEPSGDHAPPRFLLLGCHRIGSSLVEEWIRRAPERKAEIAVVDFNPNVHKALRSLGVRAVFGDLANLDLLLHQHLATVEVVACTVPDSILKGITNRQLLVTLAKAAPSARIVVTAERLDEARELYRLGAAYVLMVQVSGGIELADALLEHPPVTAARGADQLARIERCQGLIMR